MKFSIKSQGLLIFLPCCFESHKFKYLLLSESPLTWLPTEIHRNDLIEKDFCKGYEAHIHVVSYPFTLLKCSVVQMTSQVILHYGNNSYSSGNSLVS